MIRQGMHGRAPSQHRLLGSQFRLAASLITLAVTLVACQSGSSQGTGTGVLRIGLVDPFSGAFGYLGQVQLGAWQVVANEFNAQGGVTIGGTKYVIQMTSCDDQFDPATIRQCTSKEVLQDKVNLLQTAGDPQDPVMVPLAEANPVLFEDWTDNHQYLSPPNKHVWDLWCQTKFFAQDYYTALLKLEPGIKTVWFVGNDAQYDRNHGAWDKAGATADGLTWLGESYYPPTTVDFAPFLGPIVRANPSLVALGNTGSFTPAIVKTLRQLGYAGVIASDPPSNDLSLTLAGAGAAAEKTYQVEEFSWPFTTAMTKFKSQFEATGVTWNTVSALHWLADELMIAAYQKAGTITNIDAVIKALETTSIPDPLLPGSPNVTLGGLKTFGNPRELQDPMAINQIVNGAIVTKAQFGCTIP